MVVALILVPMINMVRKSDDRWWKWLLTAVALCSVSFLNVNPVLVIVAVIVIFLVVSLVNDKKLKKSGL